MISFFLFSSKEIESIYAEEDEQRVLRGENPLLADPEPAKNEIFDSKLESFNDFHSWF